MIKFSLAQITFSKYSTLLNFLIRYKQKKAPWNWTGFLFLVFFFLFHLKDIMDFYEYGVTWIQMHEHLPFLGKFLCHRIQQTQNWIYCVNFHVQNNFWTDKQGLTLEDIPYSWCVFVFQTRFKMDCLCLKIQWVRFTLLCLDFISLEAVWHWCNSMNHCLPAARYFKENECVRRMKIFYIVAEIDKTRLCCVMVARKVNCKMYFVYLGVRK